MARKNLSILIGAMAVGVAALFWSLDGVFIRPQFYHLPAALVVFFEHALGFLVLIPFLVRGRKEVQQLSLAGWGSLAWISVWGGLLGTIFITQAFFSAYNPETQTTLATVVLLQKLQPIFALLLARLILKEQLRKDFYIWAILAIIAAYFLAFAQPGMSLKEVRFVEPAALYALLAAFAFSSSTVFGKRFTNELSFSTATSLRFLATTILAFLVIFIGGYFKAIPDIQAIHWKLWVVIVFSSGALSMFIYYFGLKRIPASIATIFELVWPLSAVLLDYFVNDNHLTSIQIIAALVLLVSFFMIIRKKNNVKSEEVGNSESV